MEYIGIVALCALATATGFRFFGDALGTTTDRATERVRGVTRSAPDGVSRDAAPNLRMPTASAPSDCPGGVCSSGNCFVAGTPVATPDGLVAIESIREGDRVLSADEETGARVVRRVDRTFERNATEGLVDLTMSDGGGHIDVVRSTPDHPYWAQRRGWTLAGDLHAGDLLEDVAGATLEVVAKEDVAATAKVYNFEVESTHTYFVGAALAWVHNANCGRRFAAGTRELAPYSNDESEPPPPVHDVEPTDAPRRFADRDSDAQDRPVSWVSPTGVARNSVGVALRSYGEATRLLGAATRVRWIESTGIFLNAFGHGAQGNARTADDMLVQRFDPAAADAERERTTWPPEFRAEIERRRLERQAEVQRERIEERTGDYERRRDQRYVNAFGEGIEDEVVSRSAGSGAIFDPPVTAPPYAPPNVPYTLHPLPGHRTGDMGPAPPYRRTPPGSPSASPTESPASSRRGSPEPSSAPRR